MVDLKQENQKFREDVNKQVESIGKKVDNKHMPITLEQDILQVAQQAIGKAIGDTLSGYNSPLTKLVLSVVDDHSVELRAIIADSFSKVIGTEDFKQSIINAFSHKVARTIISNNDGLFDKVSNELKQDAIFKSKMALAVSQVVEECLLKNK
jgi:predicted oxidoreductase (fatty acid repression mutant protein)